MKRILIAAIIILSTTSIKAQEENNFGIKFSGFVKTDFFWDSRQTVSAREGHFLLWPSAVKPDDNGEDINAKANFNFLSVQSRLKGSISGPDAFGAKTSGLIEADFFAQANDNINLLRLRHALIKLNWTNLEVLAGQYWNPLFVTDCFPGTVSFNTGTPLQSFARNPQLRVSYKLSKFKIIAAALAQRDYVSRGELGISTSYLRNSATPDMHFQLHFGTKNEDKNRELVLGTAMAWKTIVPRLESKTGPGPAPVYKVDESISGITLMGFSKLSMEKLTIKFEARYGQNIPDVLAIGGFAVRDIEDALTGQRSYTPLTSMTYWGEIHTKGKIQFGLFGGILNSLGTKEMVSDIDAANNLFGFGTNIDQLIRVSPRVIINSGKTRLAFELEYTRADYCDDFDEFYQATSTTAVANFRGLLAVYYFF